MIRLRSKALATALAFFLVLLTGSWTRVLLHAAPTDLDSGSEQETQNVEAQENDQDDQEAENQEMEDDDDADEAKLVAQTNDDRDDDEEEDLVENEDPGHQGDEGSSQGEVH